MPEKAHPDESPDMTVEASEVSAVQIDDVPDEPRDKAADAPDIEAPAGIGYAEVPNPFGAGTLLAHDYGALKLALADRGAQLRTVFSEEPKDWLELKGGLQRVHDLEECAVRDMILGRRSWRMQRMFWRMTALGLPFVFASLLGAIGLLLARIPLVGPALGQFIATSGSSLGGLPPGLAVAAIPSIWVIHRTRAGYSAAAHARPSKAARRIRPKILSTGGPEYGEFIQDLLPLVEESRQLSMGRRAVSGDTAARLEVLFGAMYRVARRHGVGPAASMLSDFRRQMWRARQIAQRSMGFIAIRRLPARLDELVAPYSTREAQSRFAGFAAFLKAPAGLAAAVLLFFVGGVYRLSPDEAEVLRPNGVLAFQGSLNVLSLTDLSLFQPGAVYLDTVTPVEGPGWFWSLPPPLTNREHLNLFRRQVSVQSYLGERADGSVETVKADLFYSVNDTGKWVYLGNALTADTVAKDRLEQLLADHLALVKSERQAARDRPRNVTDALKLEMQNVLQGFVARVNTEAEIIDLGIQVEGAGSFSFPTFSP